MLANTYETTSVAWSDISQELESRLEFLHTVPAFLMLDYGMIRLCRPLVLEVLKYELGLSPIDFLVQNRFFSGISPDQRRTLMQWELDGALLDLKDRLMTQTAQKERVFSLLSMPVAQEKMLQRLISTLGALYLVCGLGGFLLSAEEQLNPNGSLLPLRSVDASGIPVHRKNIAMVHALNPRLKLIDSQLSPQIKWLQSILEQQ